MKWIIYNFDDGRILGVSSSKFTPNAYSPAGMTVQEVPDASVPANATITHKFVGGEFIALTEAEKDALYSALESNIKNGLLEDIESITDATVGAQQEQGVKITNRMRLEVGELVQQHLIKQANPAYTLATAAELPRRIDKGDGTYLEITTLAQLYSIHGKMVDRTHGLRMVSTDDRDAVVAAADRGTLSALLPTLVSNGSITQDVADSYAARIP